MSKGPRVIVALDYPDAESALALTRQLDPVQCRLKVGLELFSRAGPGIVGSLQLAGFDVFLDLKYHDIPNTVAGACRAAADMGTWMVTVHAAGGMRMMEAARSAVEGGDHAPLLVAVTVLTSLEAADLEQVGLPERPRNWAVELAARAREAGLDGAVCAGGDAAGLRERLGPDFVLVTPGIRPAGAARDDQRRVLSPAQAVAAGADYLVVGRAVTGADDPARALLTINSEIDQRPGDD